MDMTHHLQAAGLPDPDYEAEFYRDVPTKRLLAWAVDVAIIWMITAGLSVFTLFALPLLLPLFAVVSFLYRWATLAGKSATPGMRLAAIEIRRHDGARLDGGTAFLHTAGYFVSVITFPLQLISIAMMLATPRKQGLTDVILGTAALNRPAR